MSQIPTWLGRIIYLSRLRDPATDRYEHYGLSAVFGEEAAEEALRQSHQAMVENWLAMPLVGQLQDLGDYLDSLPQVRRKVLASWIRNDSFLQFLPQTATEAQRKAFLGSFRLMIRALMRVASGASETPNP